MSPASLKTQERGHQRIDILTGVVEGQRRTDCALNSHAAQDGLSTVVARSYRDALLVERDSNIFGANVIENERHHARLLACCADQPQAWYRKQFRRAVIQEIVLVGRDVLHSDFAHIIDRSSQTNRIGNVASARLKTCR